MVKGLISQLTVSVTVSPFGILMALTMLPKSIFSIIGKIIIQMRIAMGMETLAYSNFPSTSGTMGNSLPIAIPAIIQAATQRLRKRSKNDIPSLVLIS